MVEGMSCSCGKHHYPTYVQKIDSCLWPNCEQPAVHIFGTWPIHKLCDKHYQEWAARVGVGTR